MLKKRKIENISKSPLLLTSILKLHQENDAAMEDWFVTTSQIHVFNIYFMRLTTEVQLK